MLINKRLIQAVLNSTVFFTLKFFSLMKELYINIHRIQ